ncbi:MAG: hypothetical protein M1834_002490 [Cirrosporium novae-zelandiae]|nr:MAG: hypothetical protein M1834_002490 [Cirrosporium novae-zelandiae]
MASSSSTTKANVNESQKMVRQVPGSKEPDLQSYYRFHDGEWVASSSPSSQSLEASSPQKIKLLTWNIDAQAPGPRIRMSAALNHLCQLLTTPTPTIIFLQEMTPSDLEQIRATEWIRSRFQITDIDVQNWCSPYYGTVTLVDLQLRILRVFRVPWVSNMERDGLFVDVYFGGDGEEAAGQREKPIRFCNVHLESLVRNPPLRPQQVNTASQYLHDPDVRGGIMAGDFNAIEPFDKTLHLDYGLHDAFLELGGKEDEEKGFTWGYQSRQDEQERFGRQRLDKIVWCGDGVRILGLERIGMGVMVEEKYWKAMYSYGTVRFVTDHYGLGAEFVFGQGRE